MKHFAYALTHRPGFIVLGLAVLTVVALVGTLRVTLEPSNERLFLRQSDAFRVYQDFRALFGSDETILVALHDPTQPLVQPEGLAAIRVLTQALADVPHVDAVLSLTTAQDLARLDIIPFGLAAPPLIADDTLSAAQIASIRSNDLIIGTLLSADLHTAGLLITPDETTLSAAARQAWITTLRAEVTRHAMHGRQTYIAGTPLERHDVGGYLQRDQQRTIPLVFLILLVMTYSLYRNLRLALIPLGCVLLALCWTMGMVGFTGLPLNLITALLPPVMMVVSVSAAIHLLNPFLAARSAGMHGTDAVRQAIQDVGMACFLTALTTMLGFFSLLVSPVPAVREFALFAGIGVLLAFIITMTAVPLALLWLGNMAPERLQSPLQGHLDRLLDRCQRWGSTRRRTVCGGTLLILLLLLPGILRLSEGTDIVRALKPGAPLRVSTEFIDQHLTGVNSLELLVTMPDTEVKPAFIRQVLTFSHWLRTQPHVTAVHSPWEPLRGARADLLARDQQLRILAALLPLTLPLEHWINVDAKRLRISIRVKAINSDPFLSLAQNAARQADRSHLSIKLTGANYLLAQMSRTLVHTQIRSLSLAILLILGSIALAMRSWKMGLLAAIPNVLPPLMIFGLMGWCGIMLSTATTMIASVALGLIVDDTIHLLYRYSHATQAGFSPSQAIAHAVHHTGRALIITTLILTLGFWAGLIGSFKPTISFSFLTGLTMVLALFADLLVLPATLLTWAQDTPDPL